MPVLDLRSSKAHNEGLNGAGDGWEWRDWGGTAVQKLGAGSQRSGLIFRKLVDHVSVVWNDFLKHIAENNFFVDSTWD